MEICHSLFGDGRIHWDSFEVRNQKNGNAKLEISIIAY